MFDISANMPLESTLSDSELREMVRERSYFASRKELIQMLEAEPKDFQPVNENGTGEKMPMPSSPWDAVRALQRARKARRVEAEEARRVEAENAKPNFYYLKGGCRIKKSSRVRGLKPDHWRRCDAMKNGRVCSKWQKLYQSEFNNLELPYRCQECRKANRDTDPDFKPIGPDNE